MENKKRLVYAEDVKALAIKLRRTVRFDRFTGLWPCLLLTDINEVPTADAVEVVHGRWIYHECVSSFDGAISGYSCSKCNAFVNEEVFDNDEFHKVFCGNCGAKMDGGNEDG